MFPSPPFLGCSQSLFGFLSYTYENRRVSLFGIYVGQANTPPPPGCNVTPKRAYVVAVWCGKTGTDELCKIDGHFFETKLTGGFS
jgi:hypothetical protein